MVDALVSGTSDSNVVQVRVLFWAQLLIYTLMERWRNWQTRYFEGVVTIVSWEFESPPLHSFIAAIAQLVERNLAKVEVAGPNPVCRSIKTLNLFFQDQLICFIIDRDVFIVFNNKQILLN